MFNCGKTQINTTLKNKEEILKEWEDFKSKGMKGKRKEKVSKRKVPKVKRIQMSGPIKKEKTNQKPKLLVFRISVPAMDGWKIFAPEITLLLNLFAGRLRM